ncbi:unnamed protein product [Phyllotreta striolata]|uniref:Protein crumbs n=1 Tax=Phyllotreta striolata TaxID=444603 RepID=A0A9N9TXC0_PHYSR|nr:unnamed protein product [Phyllotreta striolata]
MEFPNRWKFGNFLIFMAFHSLLGPREASSSGPSHQPEAYFNGSSYLRLHTTISLKKQTGLSFRTCYGGNLFSQQLNDDLIELSVNSDEIEFTAKTAGKKYEHKIVGRFLDNRWHTVYLQYVAGNLTIEIDGYTQLLANSSYRNELLISPGLYNEGAAVLLIGKQFNGCLLEGPTVVFDPSIIKSSHNVAFKTCPIPYDSCVPKGFDWCETEPCMRHGACLSRSDTYTCICNARYSGKNCEIDLGDPCDKLPPLCKNNAANCTTDASGDFTCTCAPGYTGERCETKIKSHPMCKNRNCLNGGVCQVNPDTDEATCQCRPGFAGDDCERDTDECKSNPCLNGGSCSDGPDNFTCDCSRTGYQGRLCEEDVNECDATNPCYNGTCFNAYGSYLCQCAPGYGGRNCATPVDECLSKPCFNNGVCISLPGTYECRCINGYSGDNCESEPKGLGQGRLCEPDDPDCAASVCSRNPCLNGGTCKPYKNSFNCTCPLGFAGKICQTNVDECSSNPCRNGGICHDKIGGFQCNCTSNWMGPTCEKPYDVCELKPCKNNGTCVPSPDRREFSCRCAVGFDGETCENNVDDCLGNMCPPNQICVDLIHDYECRCPPGLAGDDCTQDVDPCSRKPCFNGTCVVDKSTHQFSCNCNPGYTGTLCKDDIDECKVSDSKICNQGICVNFEGSFQCYCKPGYTGERCNLDFDECLSTPCKNNATCINLVNNYECRCPPGYNGKDCSVNIDECEPMPCRHGATCVDGIDEFTCICPAGLSGKRCEVNIDDCASSPCLHGARCIDGLNSYACNCTDTGYEGARCDVNIDDCAGAPCVNGAPCLDLVKDYSCRCYDGYRGKNCEIDVNECESGPCQYNGTCIERSNVTLYSPANNFNLPEIFSKPFNYTEAAGYECLCVLGVTGRNCETNINECESNPCLFGTCVDKIGGYVCECEEGYEGIHCEQDINECEKYKPCVNGTCIDKIANYFCQCNGGYGGKNCSVELTGCMDEPCLNDGQCHPYLINETEHKFNCTCPNGFHGHTCEEITTMSFSGTSQVTVNTTREEGYDIQFRFKTTLGDGLLALGKGLTFYILELSKGRLNLHSSLLNKWEGVFIGSGLNDSNWQKVFVAINSSHLVLSANDEQTIYPISYNENNNVSSTSFPVTYIGGIPNNLRKLTHGQPFLVGCTEDVLINGQWVLPGNRNPSWLSFYHVEEKCVRKPQCDPNPCQSGGRCTDRWRDFSCTCERPYIGHICQYNYTAATFGHENITDSLVTVDVADYARRAVRSIVDISMFVRTRQSKGQIFYLGSGALNNPNDETYVAAQLEGGELLVRIQFEGNLESYTVGGVKLDNGFDHLIKVIRNVTLVQVKLNNTEYFRKTISASGALDVRVLYLGGQPNARAVRQADEHAAKMVETTPVVATHASVNFKGIIQDVQVSNGSSVMIVEFYPLRATDLEIPLPFGNVTFDKSTVLKGVHSDDLCKLNPCHIGNCSNTWNDYKCICPIGFKGKDCTELEFCELKGCPANSLCKNLEDGYECISNATFDGLQKPLSYGLTGAGPALDDFAFDSLELRYRTRSWGTVLFAKHKDAYLAVFVYHNEVVTEWNFNGAPETRRFRKDRFEGQWLSLLFRYKNDKLRGGFREHVVDESPDFEVKGFDVAAFTDLFKYGVVYIGGSDNGTFDYRTVIDNTDYNMTGYIPVSDTTTPDSLISNSLESEFNEDVLLYKVDQDKKTDNFKGCLGEIRIGGLLLPYFHAAEMYPNKTNLKRYFELSPDSRVEYGCVLCYSGDCLNKGVCVNSTETYKCHCQPGYTGDDCSTDIDECENNRCQNNATCVDLIDEYKCECLLGYEGEFCETDRDECASDPCRHGGTCNDLIGAFKCDCPEGFVGKQCEAPLLITCENKPCREGATCVTGPNESTGHNYTCFCTEGMEGDLCDTAFCSNRHCEHGFCNITGDVPFCDCQRGFEGKFCEINIDECVLPNGSGPCQNGGLCKDEINRYTCVCDGTGYTGLLCEIDIDECQDKADPCGGAGRCENLPGSYRCICDSIKGKCGYQCDMDDPCEAMRNPSEGGPCVHGNCRSQCTDRADYFCECEENFAGKNCTDLRWTSSESSSQLNILYIIIPVIAVLLIGLAAGSFVLLNLARSKRATRGTYSPSAQEFCNPRVELDHVLKPPPEERLI